MTHIIPCDYKKIFQDRTIFITGVGRSGTTIFGKILASMAPTYYIFEPSLTRWVAKEGWTDERAEMFRGILFEDYFLPEIQGRVNPNPNDWTYWKNHWTGNEIRTRWENLRRRKDAVEFIENEKPYFIIKNPEAQPLMDGIRNLLPGVFFVHILRHGLDVVSSTMERGWFTDDYCNSAIIEWMQPHEKCNIPWYIDKRSKELWPYWNPATRSACSWRCLTLAGENADLQFKYEDFKQNPVEFLKSFSLKPTQLTKKHVKSVLEFKDRDEKIDITEIDEPERSKFEKVLYHLNYEL